MRRSDRGRNQPQEPHPAAETADSKSRRRRTSLPTNANNPLSKNMASHLFLYRGSHSIKTVLTLLHDLRRVIENLPIACWRTCLGLDFLFRTILKPQFVSRSGGFWVNSEGPWEPSLSGVNEMYVASHKEHRGSNGSRTGVVRHFHSNPIKPFKDVGDIHLAVLGWGVSDKPGLPRPLTNSWTGTYRPWWQEVSTRA